MNYTDRAKWRSKNEESEHKAVEQALGHDTCSQKDLLNHLQRDRAGANCCQSFRTKEILCMSFEETKFANPSFGTENLKGKISKTYAEKLGLIFLK